MALNTDYNSANFLLQLKNDVEVGYASIIPDMIRVCKGFLIDVREQLEGHDLGNYNNRTKQLRESLAAYIFRNGVIIWSDEGGNGTESQRVIREQITLTPSGFDIIGIASKEYASWVESKGYNVITNQGEWFVVNLGEVFAKLGYKDLGSLKLKSPTKAITKVSYGKL